MGGARIDIVVEGLVVQEELREEAQALAVDLRVSPVHLLAAKIDQLRTRVDQPRTKVDQL